MLELKYIVYQIPITYAIKKHSKTPIPLDTLIKIANYHGKTVFNVAQSKLGI